MVPARSVLSVGVRLAALEVPMARVAYTIAATIALAAAMGSAPAASAHGQVPLGSTTVAGPVDSLFNQFLVFLKARGDSATSVDHRDHAVETRVQGLDEPIIFRFVSRGDSATVTAQGVRGGMRALIMGLAVVHDWLETNRAPGSDSSPPPRSAAWEFGGVSFPSRVEGFMVESVRRWIEQPSLGVAVTYGVAGEPVTELTLYVYPVHDDSPRADLVLSDEVVAREYECALQELRDYASAARELDELELEEERDWLATLADGSTLTGRSARLLMRWGDARIHSHLVVFMRERTFIKFRFSYDSAVIEKVLPQFERAVPQFLAAVERQRE
jgi:hypothetical protein